MTMSSENGWRWGQILGILAVALSGWTTHVLAQAGGAPGGAPGSGAKGPAGNPANKINPANKTPAPANAPGGNTGDRKGNARDQTEDKRDRTEDVRDRKEDVRDRKENMRDRQEDVRDRQTNTGAADRREDVRDRKEDIRDRNEDVRDRRENVRDRREDAADRRNPRYPNLRLNNLRPADFGIWFNRANNRLIVRNLNAGNVLSRLGFLAGDSIISVNGQAIADQNAFMQTLLADELYDQQVKVVVLRDNRETVVNVEPKALLDEVSGYRHDRMEQLGLLLDDQPREQPVVWKVRMHTPAYYAGFRKGDIITRWDGQAVQSEKELVRLVEHSRREIVPVVVERDRIPHELEMEVPAGEYRTAYDSTTGYHYGRDREEPRGVQIDTKKGDVDIRVGPPARDAAKEPLQDRLDRETQGASGSAR